VQAIAAAPNDRASVSVMLIVPDAPAAVSWYRTALGAAELWNLGSVAGLHLRDAPFMLHEAVPGRKTEPSPIEVGVTTTRIEVFVDDPGGFTDPSGYRWSVGDRTPLQRYSP
jgi:catechol 2,3-dioxygenase-like lactoylglutathione lyase family enzyme